MNQQVFLKYAYMLLFLGERICFPLQNFVNLRDYVLMSNETN